MKNFKVAAVLLISFLALLVITACSQSESGSGQEENTDGSGQEENTESSGDDENDEIVLRLGHGTATNSLYHKGSEKFKELVEEKTDGEITVELYPDGQLGHDRDLTEGMDMGTVEMGMIGVEPLTSMAPKLQAVNLPYLFTDRETAYEVLDGEIGQEMVENLPEESGMRVLGYFENGFRNVSNSQQPIEEPEDLNGLDIRTPESDVSLSIFNALGANPTPMDFGELYTGLEQGTVDGQENPVSLIYTAKLYEVQDYVSLTNHMYSPMVLAISEQTWSSLSSEQQDIVMEASDEAKQYERELSQEEEANYIDMLKEEGTNINEPETEPFEEATQEVYEEYKGDFDEEFYEKLMEATE
ncbi:TRAP transporter substrate-binding protein [Salibacterium qingdaonense]|uniref:Tripartite ATP-independent transporter solute receptor, DctP family n=1 Tax=Salibacterium qingdaonense TaxID=266892 RepID=A0A1I4NUA4_9BACI|nr:TRAP transporter substrate-binding protein [Salibacterium qingdaonense]SFM19092.1 tripartite ATP-independent transporter solute receptor, DctP family [Salibacterium qingdaonense]